MGPPSTSTSNTSSSTPLHGTLLGLIATDAAVEPEALQKALTYAVDRSFNAISVDGDMSTNDTVVAFANGASGMEKELVEGEEDWVVFRDGLTEFAEELAKLVVRDGEGATKFVTVTVKVSFILESFLLRWRSSKKEGDREEGGEGKKQVATRALSFSFLFR